MPHFDQRAILSHIHSLTHSLIDTMTDTPIWTAEEQNIEYAKQLAEALIRLDGHSAQLRLVHSGPLRDGEFDLARLQLIRGHLADIQNAAGPCLNLASQLTPTVTIEAASPQAEKEEK